MALATSALYGARPAVEVDGADARELTERVLSVLVTETADGLARCEVAAGNWDGGSGGGSDGYVFNDRSLVDFGASLVVRLGDGDRAGTVFSGVVTGMEAHYPQQRAPQVVFLAEDRLQDLRMTRRTRSFEDVSDDDVIRSVVNGHGLDAELDVDGPTHRHVAQLNQSDLAFIRDRARLVDADVWIDGTTVHVQARARRSGEVALTYNADLREVSVLADLAHQRTAVVVAGWDVTAKDAIAVEAGISAIQPELDGDTAGVTLLERALGPRAQTLVQTVPVTVEEARARAETSLRETARRFVVAHGVAEGDARLRAGTAVRLAGLGAAFNGRYQLVEVEHAFDDRHGYLTRFRAERPGLGGGS